MEKNTDIYSQRKSLSEAAHLVDILLAVNKPVCTHFLLYQKKSSDFILPEQNSVSRALRVIGFHAYRCGREWISMTDHKPFETWLELFL